MKFNTKPQRTCLSVAQQKAILELVDQGHPSRWIENETGVKMHTIRGIKRRREKIETALGSTRITHKKIRDVKHPNVEKALYLWFLQSREANVRLSDAILQAKALDFHKLLCETATCKFVASSGWVDKFKKRHEIRALKIAGEKLSANHELVEPFRTELKEIITEMNLPMDCCYNADESALYYLVLPNTTLVAETEKTAAGQKARRDRITFMPCCNITGTNRPDLQVIGRANQPRCFKTKPIPADVFYTSSKNAWQTRRLFKQWFDDVFVPSVKRFAQEKGLPEKALLVLDNASAHKEFDIIGNEDFRVIFLPPNLTSILQPMDQQTILPVKTRYRKALLESIINEFESGDWLTNLKNWTLSDAIQLLNKCWKELDRTIIFNSWNNLLHDFEPYKLMKAGLQISENFMDRDVNYLISMVKSLSGTEYDFQELLNWMKQIDGAAHDSLADEEIVNLIINPESFVQEEVPESDVEDAVVQVPADIEMQNGDSEFRRKMVSSFDNLIGLYTESKELNKVHVLQDWKTKFILGL